MNERQIISLRPHLDILYRHRRSFVCVLAAGLGLTASALLMLPDVYRSSALVMSEPAAVARIYAAATNANELRNRVQLLGEEALGRARLMRIIADFDLYPRRRAAHQPLGEIADYMRARVTLVPLSYSGQRQFPAEGPGAFTVSFEYPDAALARKVTARLTAILISHDLRQRIAAAAAADEFLRERAAHARAALESKGAEIKAYKARYAGALPEELPANLQELDRLQGQLDMVTEALARAQTASPRNRLKEMEARLITLRARYSDQYPDVIALRAEIGALKRSQPRRRDGTADGAATETPGGAELAGRRAALRAEISGLRARIAETPAHEQELAALSRDYDVLGNNYALLMRRWLEAQTAAMLARRGEGGRLRVVDPANLPLRPARPNRLAIVVLGALLSIAAAAAVAFALFFTDTSFKDPEELARAYGGGQLLVAIPEIKEIAGRRERWHGALGAAAAACAALSTGVVALWMYATRAF